MATIFNLSQPERQPPKKRKSRQRKQPQNGVCSPCGRTECFVRPRFFSGQLLTDEDLALAQRYAIEKNRLHNRYLFGQGVVCGLAVRCHPCCDGSVIVESGYAIDCCGNDIVLCDSAEFNVVEYLEACRQAEESDCYEKIRERSSFCDEAPKEYYLILSYAEKLDKPVTALIRDNGCTTNRCEPSRIKETFRLDLVLKDDVKKTTPQGFCFRVSECFQTIIPQFRKLKGDFQEEIDNNDIDKRHANLLRIFCLMEAFVLDIYKKHPKVRCGLYEELSEIKKSFPSSASKEKEDYVRASQQMDILILQFYVDCICNALLVPCKECDGQEGVLLACLTLQGDKITKICNTVRKPVLSGPALQYWLQPLYTIAGSIVSSICCKDLTNIIQPQQLDFSTINSTLKRSEAAFRIAQDVPANVVANLQNFVFSQVSNPQTISAMDVYNRPLREVESMLSNRNIDVSVSSKTTTAEAYALGNLNAMSWTVPDGSRVELVVSPENLVTCIRVLEEEV